MTSNEPSIGLPSIEVPGFPGTDLGALAPHDVVALKEYVDHYSDSNGSAAERLNRAMDHALSGVLETLPERSLKFGHAVLQTYAECPDNAIRAETGLWVPSLARADHDAGVALWDRLLRDEYYEARNIAQEMLVPGLKPFTDSGSVKYTDTEFAKLGLTWRDGIQLLASYEGARRGEGVVYVDRSEDYDEDRYLEQLRAQGRVALFKLVNLTNPATSRNA